MPIIYQLKSVFVEINGALQTVDALSFYSSNY
jgi:hypothetical protein